MKKQNLIAILGLFALFIVAFSSGRVIAPANAQGVVGGVYIMTNSASGNQVIAYSRGPDGILSWQATFATNGLGTGNGLGNQGGLVLSQDGQWLIVVNAGSNDISLFRVSHNGLTLTDKTSSQGSTPISVTEHGNLVYVLDAGGLSNIGNIAGYSLNDNGQLSAIAGSVQPLSGVTAPAQISFNPSGTVLVVTEKTTNKIDTFTLNRQGVASAPNVQASGGATPFGFGFTRSGTLIVSEAAGGPSGTSAVSSYAISDNGDLTTLSGSVPDTQQAACWIAVTGNGQFAYTTNTHSNTISSYSVNDGNIKLQDAVAASTDHGPLDMALARNSHFLYVFNSGSHTIEGFSVNANGSLTWIDTITTTGADGLAAN